MFKTNFFVQNKIWAGIKSLGGALPRMPTPVATGLRAT